MVGPIPDEAIADAPNLFGRIAHHPSLSHEEMLALLRTSHVLFHPAPHESFGAVLMEAAAAGMAVIVGSGPGMEHVPEWFAHGGVRLVDRSSPEYSGDAAAFYEALQALLSDRARAEALGRRNHRACSTGALSLGRRDDVLLSAYAAAGGGERLQLEDVVQGDATRVWRLPSSVVMRLRNESGLAMGLGDPRRGNEDLEIPVEL